MTMQTQQDRELAMLRSEIELLMGERRALLRVVGAAAEFVAQIDSHALPPSSYEVADRLALAINGLSEDSLRDALELLEASREAAVGSPD